MSKHYEESWFNAKTLNDRSVNGQMRREIEAKSGSSSAICRIDAILRRAYKCGFYKNLITVTELLTQSSTTVFRKIKYNLSHCLNTLLYRERNLSTTLLETAILTSNLLSVLILTINSHLLTIVYLI